jgi:hypothetical protein
VVGEAAVSAARTDTFLGERYRRIARRRGKKRAIVAVGRSILVIIWALLSDDDARFVDLGADYHASRTNPEPERPKRSAVVGHDGDRRDHVALLVALGEVGQRAAGQVGGLGERGLDRGDRVVGVRRRCHVPARLVLAPVVPAAGQPPRAAGGGLDTGEKSSCHTQLGPVGSVAKAALRRAASWRRSRR